MEFQPLRHNRDLQSLVVLLDPPGTSLNAVPDRWTSRSGLVRGELINQSSKGGRVHPNIGVAVQPREYVTRKTVTLVERKVFTNVFNFHNAHSMELFRDLSSPISASVADDKDCVLL
jgi:hypothetical protein